MAARRRKAERDADERRLVSDYREARDALLGLADVFGQRAQVVAMEIPETRRSVESDRPTLEIDCLGSFSVRLDGDALHLRTSGKSVGVLKFLSARPSYAAPRDLLLEALWPNADSDAASNRLRVAVHGLRRMLQPDLAPNLVLHESGMYRIDPGFHVIVDAERFSELWERAERLEEADDRERADVLYREAESLYHGDYFEEDLYEEWAQIRRESLRDVFLTLEYRLAMHARDRGDLDACIDRASKIVERDSCNEEAYALLMESHAARGHPLRALRWFDVCKRSLRSELNTEPSAALMHLRDSVVGRNDALS